MSIWAHLRTLLVVTLLSAVVWLFAEAETLRGSDVTATIIIRPATGPDSLMGESGMVVTLVATRDAPRGSGDGATPEARVPVTTREAGGQAGVATQTVQVRLRGTPGSVEMAQRALRSTIELVLGSEPDLPNSEGEIEIDLLRVLSKRAVFQEAGVLVSGVQPARVIVRHDGLVTRSIPVAVVASGIDLQGLPRITPPIVSVTMTRAASEQLGFAPTARIVLSARDVDGMSPGQSQTLTGRGVLAPAEIADKPFVSVRPASADVTLTLRSRIAEATLSDVPVQVRLSPTDMERYVVRIAPQHRVVSSVRVVGPTDAISTLQDRQRFSPLIATITLTTADLEARIDSKELSFGDAPTSLRFEPSILAIPLEIAERGKSVPTQPTGPETSPAPGGPGTRGPSDQPDQQSPVDS